MHISLLCSQELFKAHLNNFFSSLPFLDQLTLYRSSHLSEFYGHLFSKSRYGKHLVVIEGEAFEKEISPLLDSIRLHLPQDRVILLTEHSSRGSLPNAVDRVSVNGLERLQYAIVSSLKLKNASDQSPPMLKREEQDVETLFKRYQRVIDGAGEAIVGLNAKGHITFTNIYACKLFERSEGDLLKEPFDKFSLDSPLIKGSTATTFTGKGCESRRVGRGVIQRPNGSLLYVEYTHTYVGHEDNDDDDTVSIMVIEDISDRIKFEAKLKALAAKDMLTGVYNRYYFHRILRRELSNRRESCGKELGLALIDLDGFKEINDTHGHAVGDKVLAIISNRLKDNVRRGDCVGRLGGDEFAVIFRQTHRNSLLNTANTLLKRISEPVAIEDLHLRVSASMGVCFSGDANYHAETMLQQSDEAMYQAKRTGKSGVVLFDDKKSLQKLA